MRQTAARLNRTWLTILGLVLVLTGAAGLLLGTGLAGPLVRGTGLGWTPPEPDRALFGRATASALAMTWVVVLLAVVAVALAALGLAWLVAQLPRRNAAKPFRIHDDARTGLTRVDPGVLGAAVEAQTERLPGVTGAAAVIRGSLARPDLTLRVTADDRTDLPRLLGQIHGQVAADLGAALDTRLRRLGVQVEISSTKAARDRITL